jgi:hypothetical protein
MTKARDLASSTPVPSTVSATELGYVDGVTSAIQTQVDSKLATATASSTYQTITATGLVKVIPSSAVNGTVGATGAVTFSGASSVSFNGCFSSAYQNYKMVLNISASTGSDLTIKLRASGTDATTNYNRYGIAINSAGSPTNYGSATAGGFFYLAQQSTIDTGCEFNLYSPFESTATKFHAISSGGTSPVFIGGRHTTASSYDGFSLLPDSGTITGVMRIYGFNN